jgi:hypothetical protein
MKDYNQHCPIAKEWNIKLKENFTMNDTCPCTDWSHVLLPRKIQRFVPPSLLQSGERRNQIKDDKNPYNTVQ